MASYIQGLDMERFATTIDRNFICSICSNVLEDPVLCQNNHHCFCRGCITKYLENSQRCPTCSDELTVETLAEPQRMVKRMLNELNIRCVYVDRGCQEILQLQHLVSHEATCGFTPAICTNQVCGATLNQRDLFHHESEVCEFRKLKIHSCGEMTKTLTDMEEKIANLEKNMATNVVTMETNMKNIEKSMATNAASAERNAADMEEKLEAVNNEVTGFQEALIDAFIEMKDVLIKMDDKIKENTRKVRNTPSGDRENIIVAGGWGTGSVEMFDWHQRTWSPLQSLPNKRHGATSFLYHNHVTIAGGYCSHPVDGMIRMNVHPNPDLAMHWSNCPVELPPELAGHSSVLYNDHLIVSGGQNGNAASDCIHEVQLVPPCTVKTLSRMPEPRQFHSMERFDDSLLIVGGTTTSRYQDSVSSVVLYDIKKNECKQLSPLPYEVSEMATVRWGNNIVVIGGRDKQGNALDTVIMYNVKSGQHHVVPEMRLMYNNTNPTETSTWTDSNRMKLNAFLDELGLAQKIILIIFAICTIVGNTLVLVATWRERSLHQPNKYFVVCLATADLLVGVTLVPLRVYRHSLDVESQRTMSIHLCRFMVWIDTFALAASIYTLTFISFDRYLKITKPLQYIVRMTTSKSLKIIFFIWLCSTAFATYAATPHSGSQGILETSGNYCHVDTDKATLH
ncbi:E3 ubiquitin- ligase PDZRN3-like [Paramuricea clavata]|uniref:E3 ubiquitin- ligase PDZRN3-like n=1 Tax=Paramuricea clavata TaxID=317549 RepID=A0A7D9IG55_PARCT|nr:E3 ubiquitin- ligase PDZRN3-like [Paramuricea clavata]